jgi:hypothetical protein
MSLKGEDGQTTELPTEIHLHHNTKRRYHLSTKLSRAALPMLGRRKRGSYLMAKHL